MKLLIPSVCIYSALVELQDTPRLCAEGWMMDVYSSILYIGDGLFPVYTVDQPEISTANPQSSLSLESVVWRGNVEAVLRAWALSVMCVSSITAHYSGVCMHIYSGNKSYITVMLKKKKQEGWRISDIQILCSCVVTDSLHTEKQHGWKGGKEISVCWRTDISAFRQHRYLPTQRCASVSCHSGNSGDEEEDQQKFLCAEIIILRSEEKRGNPRVIPHDQENCSAPSSSSLQQRIHPSILLLSSLSLLFLSVCLSVHQSISCAQSGMESS